MRATIIATDFTDGVMVKDSPAPTRGEQAPQASQPSAKPAAAAPKRDAFTLEPPRFMQQPTRPSQAKPKTEGAFAFPAFRLTPDDKDQK